MGSVWLVYVDPWNRRREMEPQECKHAYSSNDENALHY